MPQTAVRPSQLANIPVGASAPVLLAGSTTEITCANTVSETGIASLTVLGSTIPAGATVVMNVWGTLLHNAAGTITFKLYYTTGASVLAATSALTPATSATALGVQLRGIMKMQNTLSQKGTLAVLMNALGDVGQGTGTADASQLQSLDITVTWSAASASLSFTALYTSVIMYPPA